MKATDKQIDNPDTTGQLVMAYTGLGLTEITIAEDNGHYPNTKPEYNVRKLKIIDRFTGGRSVTADRIAAQDGYGCGWGETSKLYPITGEQADQIRLEVSTPPKTKPAGPGRPCVDHDLICRHCGTVCYGDCQA